MSATLDCGTSCCAVPQTQNVPGVQGQNAFTFTTASFVVPALGAQVTISVINSDWVSLGQTIFIEGAGTFTVSNINSSTSVLLTYQNVSSNTATGNTIAAGAEVSPAGIPGAGGINGTNAFTVVGGGSPNTPAKGGSIIVPVADSTWIVVGQDVFVENSGYYLVTAKTDTTHFTGTYLNVFANTNSGNAIAAGSGVGPAGSGIVNPIPELDLTNTASTAISTPAAGVTAVYVDPLIKDIKTKDDAGYVRGSQFNFSTIQQAPAATVRTYITGSKITVPANNMQIGTMFKWRFNMAKTAAGSASSTIDIAVGTAGTTADTARLSFTKPAGTAAADEAWCEVIATVRGPLSGVGVVVGEFTMIHNLASTGHATIPCVVVNTISAGFDVTVANLFVGLCITTGASDVITIEQVQAEAYNM